MRIRRVASMVFVVALVVLGLVSGRPAAANGQISGLVIDGSGTGIAQVCVWLGVVHLSTNCTYTDATGRYVIGPGLPDNLAWDLYFYKPGYVISPALHIIVTGATTVPTVTLAPAPAGGGGGGGAPPPTPSPTPTPAASACNTVGDPTATLYLPNVTKTLGGPDGWQTPFIVQNVGTSDTVLEVSFFRFLDGSLVTCRQIRGLHPGTSFADVPNNDLDLSDDTQFAVVVRSFGSAVVSVVNEHRGVGARAEALSYVARRAQ